MAGDVGRMNIHIDDIEPPQLYMFQSRTEPKKIRATIKGGKSLEKSLNEFQIKGLIGS